MAPVEREWTDGEMVLGAEVFDQSQDAMGELSRPAGQYLVMPWPTLYSLTGPLAPGDIWFVAAFSGRGKTTLLTSLCDELLQRGDTVFYCGLETRPKMLRTYFAAYRKGYEPGAILSGTAKLEWESWPSVRAELMLEIQRMMRLPDDGRLFVSGKRRIVAEELGEVFDQAREVRARVVVIDHIDQVQADRASAYAASRAVVETLEDMAKHFEIPVLVATQLNNEVLRGDPLAQLRPPQPHHVFMGGHKRHVATGMLGLYRPLDPQVSPDVLKAVRKGEREVLDVALPHTMAVACMKHRHFGSREGKSVHLGVTRGRVHEQSERDEYGTSHEAMRRI